MRAQGSGQTLPELRGLIEEVIYCVCPTYVCVRRFVRIQMVLPFTTKYFVNPDIYMPLRRILLTQVCTVTRWNQRASRHSKTATASTAVPVQIAYYRHKQVLQRCRVRKPFVL